MAQNHSFDKKAFRLGSKHLMYRPNKFNVINFLSCCSSLGLSVEDLQGRHFQSVVSIVLNAEGGLFCRQSWLSDAVASGPRLDHLARTSSELLHQMHPSPSGKLMWYWLFSYSRILVYDDISHNFIQHFCWPYLQNKWVTPKVQLRVKVTSSLLQYLLFAIFRPFDELIHGPGSNRGSSRSNSSTTSTPMKTPKQETSGRFLVQFCLGDQ